MYVIIFTCVIVLPMVYLLSLTPIINQLIVSTAFALDIISCMLILIGPRVLLILEGADLNNNMRIVRGESGVSSAGVNPASTRYAVVHHTGASDKDLAGSVNDETSRKRSDSFSYGLGYSAQSSDFPEASRRMPGITDNLLGRLLPSKRQKLIEKLIACEKQMLSLREELALLDNKSISGKSVHNRVPGTDDVSHIMDRSVNGNLKLFEKSNHEVRHDYGPRPHTGLEDPTSRRYRVADGDDSNQALSAGAPNRIPLTKNNGPPTPSILTRVKSKILSDVISETL